MSINVRTLAVTDERKVEIMNLETTDLVGNEVLVKVHAVALCTLEQRLFVREVKMPLPCTGGHEVAGEIVALGDGVNTKKWAIGDRVSVRMLYSCGECYYCRTGHTNMCERSQKKPVRKGLLIGPGGLCDYLVVDPSNLFKIPDDISYEEAALTEPLGCVVHSINRANIELGQDVLVIGGGIMGQYHVMLAKKRGARVIMSEVDESRRKLAEEHGADITFNPLEKDPVEYVRSLTEGRGADVVFNTTAIPAVVPQAIDMTAKAGIMIQYSSMHPDAPTPISPQRLHGEEIVLTGTISPTGDEFYTANRLISSKIVDVKKLIAKTFPFEKGQEAFEAAVVPGTFRVIITD